MVRYLPVTLCMLGNFPCFCSVVRLTDRLDMTIAVDWNVKQQTKPNSLLLLPSTNFLSKLS